VRHVREKQKPLGAIPHWAFEPLAVSEFLHHGIARHELVEPQIVADDLLRGRSKGTAELHRSQPQRETSHRGIGPLGYLEHRPLIRARREFLCWTSDTSPSKPPSRFIHRGIRSDMGDNGRR
jgi:hypothetical protein